LVRFLYKLHFQQLLLLESYTKLLQLLSGAAASSGVTDLSHEVAAMRAGLLSHVTAAAAAITLTTAAAASSTPQPLAIDDLETAAAESGGTISPSAAAAGGLSPSASPVPMMAVAGESTSSPRASPISPAEVDEAAVSVDGGGASSSPLPEAEQPRSPSPAAASSVSIDEAAGGGLTEEDPTPVASGSEAEDGNMIVVVASAASSPARLLPEIAVSPPPSPLPTTAAEAGEALHDLLVAGRWEEVWRLWRGCRHLLAQVSSISRSRRRIFYRYYTVHRIRTSSHGLVLYDLE
jgi:hypothetical protein